MTSKIFLYAEVLTNIRQVTLHASLQSERNEATKIDIASDRKTVSVSHDGQTVSIFLPTAISGSANVTIPAKRAKELSLRLEIAPSSEILKSIDVIEDKVPWSASSLNDSTKLCCRKCQCVLYAPTTATSWRDLPSEKWADMMDFWHCHKPHDDQHDGNAIASSKGYGASNAVRALSGVGLVDTLSFLLTEADCQGVKVSQERLPTGHESLQCANCNQLVGFADRPAQGYRLYKWSVLLRSSDQSFPEAIPAERLICLQFLALIDSTGLRRFLLHSGIKQSENLGLLVWVFNPDIRYSSSAITGAKRAMKVFYRSEPNVQETLDENSASVEELFLPQLILKDFSHNLEKSNNLLPPSARKFQAWNVALLDRCENGSSAQEVADTLSNLGLAKDPQDERKYLYE